MRSSLVRHFVLYALTHNTREFSVSVLCAGGADTDVDYAAVDNDATLDDYWRKDREWEIQEKYFEEE